MDLREERYMAALAEEGSITRAAKFLGLSQPALSKWLSQLEEAVGQTLVIRSPQGLVFTQAGQIYLEGCRKSLDAALKMQESLKALSSDRGRTIILGGSPIRGAQAFARIYSPFHSRYPRIDLQFFSAENVNLKKRLLDGQITMSLLGAMETNLPDLEYMKFMDEELLLLLPKGHPLSYAYESLPPNEPYPVIDLRSLKDTPILVNKTETSYGGMLLAMYREMGLEANIVFRSNIIPLLYEMVLNGVGATLIPDSYYNPKDGISAYSLSPRIIVYQGIGLRRGYALREEEEYLIHLVMNNWGSPYYMHEYVDYYMEKRKRRIEMYEHSEV